MNCEYYENNKWSFDRDLINKMSAAIYLIQIKHQLWNLTESDSSMSWIENNKQIHVCINIKWAD